MRHNAGHSSVHLPLPCAKIETQIRKYGIKCFSSRLLAQMMCLLPRQVCAFLLTRPCKHEISRQVKVDIPMGICFPLLQQVTLVKNSHAINLYQKKKSFYIVAITTYWICSRYIISTAHLLQLLCSHFWRTNHP